MFAFLFAIQLASCNQQPAEAGKVAEQIVNQEDGKKCSSNIDKSELNLLKATLDNVVGGIEKLQSSIVQIYQPTVDSRQKPETPKIDEPKPLAEIPETKDHKLEEDEKQQEKQVDIKDENIEVDNSLKKKKAGDEKVDQSIKDEEVEEVVKQKSSSKDKSNKKDGKKTQRSKRDTKGSKRNGKQRTKKTSKSIKKKGKQSSK